MSAPGLPGYGAKSDMIGPELPFGHVMGEAMKRLLTQKESQ
jgi:hypothetical protein